jgi:ABC-type oligopeptide transport system ATPase subunit
MSQENLASIILSANHLVKTYTQRSGRFGFGTCQIKALDDVSVQLRTGTTLAVVGESGSGKSTLARCLLQLHPFDSGEVIFDGIDLAKIDKDALRQQRKNLQMVFQDPFASLNPRMKVGEIVGEGLKPVQSGLSDKAPPNIKLRAGAVVRVAKTAKGDCTATFTPTIPKAGRYEVRVAYTASPSRDEKVPIQILHADGEEDLTIDQSTTPPIDARFISLGTYRFEKDGAGFILVSNAGTTGHVTLDAVWLLDEATLAKEEKSRTARSNPQLTTTLAEQKRLQKEIKTLEKTGPTRPETMSVLDDASPADCPIHIRGNIRNLGPTVPRGIIQAIEFTRERRRRTAESSPQLSNLGVPAVRARRGADRRRPADPPRGLRRQPGRGATLLPTLRKVLEP